MPKMTIIGGGITGLTAAFYVEKYMPEYDVVLLESSNRVGGKIATYEEDGFAVERGPDSYVARKTAMTELIEEVGLGDQLVRNGVGQAYVLNKDGLHPIPKQTVMGIPLNLDAFAETTLLSQEQHAQLRERLTNPPALDVPEGDVSLGHYLRERVGDPLVDRLIEPLLSGIYAGSVDDMSALATFPQFLEAERLHGNLYEGMRHLRPEQRAAQVGDKQPVGQFASLRGGLNALIDRLVDRLERTTIVCDTTLTSLEKRVDGYRLETTNGDYMTDELVLTVPPRLVATLLPEVDSDFLQEMTPHATATCSLVYREEDVDVPFVGTGFVASQEADVTITACTFIDQKWPHAVPEGYRVFRVFVGRPGADDIVSAPDETIVATALADLERFITFRAAPERTIVSRLFDGLPPYAVDHAKQVERLRQQMAAHYPGVILAGIAYDGIGIPDCIRGVKQQLLQLHERA